MAQCIRAPLFGSPTISSTIHVPLQVFDWPYSDVARAIFRKYPNPHAAHVVTVDTSHVKLDLDTGILRVERIIGARQPPPKWIDKLVPGGIGSTYVREISFILPNGDCVSSPEPAILQASRNLSLSKFVICHERISYASKADSVGSTTFRQLADFVAQGSMAAHTLGARFGKKLEQVSVDRFASNADLGHRGFESVLQGLYHSSVPQDDVQSKL